MKMLDKNFYIGTGVVLSIVGIGLVFQAILTFNSPTTKVDVTKERMNVISACMDYAQGQLPGDDIDAKSKEGKVSIKGHSLNSYEEKLYKLSMITENCQGFEMKKFCIGTSCDLSELTGDKEMPESYAGYYLGLEYNEETEYFVTKKSD